MKRSIIKLIFIFNLYFVAFSPLPAFSFKLVDTNIFLRILQNLNIVTSSLTKIRLSKKTQPNPQLREWHFGSYIKYFNNGDYKLEISTEANKVNLGSPLIVEKFKSYIENGEEVLEYSKLDIPDACEIYTCQYEIENKGWEGNTKKLLLKFTWDTKEINPFTLKNLEIEAQKKNQKEQDQTNDKKLNSEVGKNTNESLNGSDKEEIDTQNENQKKQDQTNDKKLNSEVGKNTNESLNGSDQEEIDTQNEIITPLQNNKNTKFSNIKSSNHPTLDKDFSGLKNVGNTCYFNVILQILFMNEEFRNNILSLKLPNTVPQKLTNTREDNSLIMLGYFQKLFGEMVARESVVDPTNVFKNVYNINNELMKIGEEQDMSEYFMLFIAYIQAGINHLQIPMSPSNDQLKIYKNGASATNPVNDKTNNFMDRIFYGKLKSEITETVEEVEIIQEDLKNKNQIMHLLIFDCEKKTVENALNAFFKEVLEEKLNYVN